MRLQCVSGHALLILRIIFFFLRGGNCVTLIAICVSLWCVSSVRLCVCTPVEVRQLTWAGGCMRICAHLRVRAQKSRSCTCVYLRLCACICACVCAGRWSREPKLSYLKLFLLSDRLASQRSLCPSSVFVSISSGLSSSPPPAWIDDGLWLSRWMMEHHSGSDQTRDLPVWPICEAESDTGVKSERCLLLKW